MAISVTSLTSGSSTSNVTSYATASITPTAGRVVFVAVSGTGLIAGTHWTVTGLSGTWNRFADHFYSNANSKHIDVFWCTDFTGSGTLTLGNTDSATGCLWSVFEVDGADTTTPVVTSNVVSGNSGATNVASLSLTLSAASNSNNRPFAVFTDDDNTAADHVARTNWTAIHTNGVITPAQGHLTEWRSDTFETTASMSNSVGTATFLMAGIAWEVKAAATGSTTASAENAASTVTANQPSPNVSASSNLATVAMSAPQPTSSIKGSANLVTVAATAYDATIKTESPTATPSNSTVGVNANNPSPSVAAKAACP